MVEHFNDKLISKQDDTVPSEKPMLSAGEPDPRGPEDRSRL